MFTGQSWLIAHDSVKRDLSVSLYNRDFSCFLTGFDLKYSLLMVFFYFCWSLRPRSDAELFMSRTLYIDHELSTWKFGRLNQLGMPISIGEWLSRSICLAQPGISPLQRLWNDFDSDAKLFMCQIYCINYYNLFCKKFDRNEHFPSFELSSQCN